jgi:hypothetical protein
MRRSRVLYSCSVRHRLHSVYALVCVLAACGCAGAADVESNDGGDGGVEATAYVDTAMSDVALDGGAGDGPRDASVAFDTGGDTAPPPTCDPRSFGAKADGKTKDTVAIQTAIDACAGTYGTVLLRDGVFLSGMLTLKSEMTFTVDATATLRGTQDDADYPRTEPKTDNTQLLNCRKALLYAERAHDLRIDGKGTIDGNGNTPKWIGPSTLHPEATRPMAIYTTLSDKVTIADLRVKNAAMWGVVNLETDHLWIHDLVIDTPLSGNRDGIDVVDCHHVLVEDVTVTSEDDAICLKSGTARGVDDVLVRRVHVVRSIVANALKMGTASYGAFTHVTFEDITIDSADKAAMAVESVDGALISDILFQRIQFKDVGSPFFVILGDRGTTPLGSIHRVGSIDRVRFTGITGTSTRHTWGSPISGTQTKDGVIHRLRDLVFENVTITGIQGGLTSIPKDPPEYAGQYPDPNLWGDTPGFAWFIRHAEGVTFDRAVATTSKDARKATETRDVTGFIVK